MAAEQYTHAFVQHAFEVAQYITHRCNQRFRAQYIAVHGEEKARSATNVPAEHAPLDAVYSSEYGNMFDSAAQLVQSPHSLHLTLNEGTHLYDMYFRDIMIEEIQKSPHHNIFASLMGDSHDVMSMLSYSADLAENTFPREVEYAKAITLPSTTIFVWLSQYDAMLPAIDSYTEFIEQQSQHRTQSSVSYIPAVKHYLAIELALKTDVLLSSREALDTVEETKDAQDIPWSWFAPLWAEEVQHVISRYPRLHGLYEYFAYFPQTNPLKPHAQKTPLSNELLQNMIRRLNHD